MSELNTAQINIRDLVSQVKSGNINKKDAFKELHNILKKAPSVGEGDEAGSAAFADEDDDASTSTGGRISQEDRRLLINKLIEQKRNARAEAEAEAAASVAEGVDGGDDGMFGMESHQYEDASFGDQWGAGDVSTQRPRSASTGRIGGRGGGAEASDSYFTRRSADHSGIARDSRSNRIAQTEAVIRHEMFKDCTFRPEIKALPASYGSQKETDGDFYDRVTRWQKDKAHHAARRKVIQEDQAVTSCTFQPKINKNSLRAVKEIRGMDGTEDPSERLYKNHELSILQRSKYIEEELSRERDMEVSECTFNPDISSTNTNRFRQVRCKVSAKPKVRDTSASNHPDAKNCTFAPKVKGVSRHMTSAQVYVSSNVVDRLTKPLVQGAEIGGGGDSEHKDGPVMDMASFMGALNQSSMGGASLRSPNKSQSQTLNLSTSTGSGVKPKEGKVLDKKSLENFLGRQEQMALRKDSNSKEIKGNIKPTFQPRLCKRSIQLSERNHKGDFLERVERDVLRRADHEIRAAVIPDESCTFQPAITQKSEKLRPRTVYEMSRGDQRKRETNNRMMRMRSEQEQLADMTFKPEISKKAKATTTKGQKYSLAHDTAKFLEMQREKAQRKEQDRLLALEKRERDELDKCTFAPATKDCPAYVRRIAKSMAVVRSSRAQTNQASGEAEVEAKPTWK